jgi:hypothetical protein
MRPGRQHRRCCENQHRHEDARRSALPNARTGAAQPPCWRAGAKGSRIGARSSCASRRQSVELRCCVWFGAGVYGATTTTGAGAACELACVVSVEAGRCRSPRVRLVVTAAAAVVQAMARHVRPRGLRRAVAAVFAVPDRIGSGAETLCADSIGSRTERFGGSVCVVETRSCLRRAESTRTSSGEIGSGG